MDFGEFHTLMPELRQDEKHFYIYFRMPSECFDEILSLIKEDITKMDTNYREAISAEERLAITLRYKKSFFKYKFYYTNEINTSENLNRNRNNSY